MVKKKRSLEDKRRDLVKQYGPGIIFEREYKEVIKELRELNRTHPIAQ